MEGPRKGDLGETGIRELPPSIPFPQQLPMATAAVAAVDSLEAAAAGGGGGAAPPAATNVLMRQTSIGSANAASKINNNNCLCSPTTHAGSFRCRHHRAPSSPLQRTKSIDLSDSVAGTAPPDS